MSKLGFDSNTLDPDDADMAHPLNRHALKRMCAPDVVRPDVRAREPIPCRDTRRP